MLARLHGVGLTLTVLADPAGPPVFEAAGVDVTIDPGDETAEKMARFTFGERTRQVAMLGDEEAELEVLDITVRAEQPVRAPAGRRGARGRGGGRSSGTVVFFPDGTDELRPGDRAVVLSEPERVPANRARPVTPGHGAAPSAPPAGPRAARRRPADRAGGRGRSPRLVRARVPRPGGGLAGDRRASGPSSSRGRDGGDGSGAGRFWTRAAGRRWAPRRVCLVVVAVWLLVPAFGALLLLGRVPQLDHPVDAYFEAMSGFAATRALVLTDVDAVRRHAVLAAAPASSSAVWASSCSRWRCCRRWHRGP
ncbi:hypothetical protein [Tsukamurella paurometabola]